MSRRDAFTQVQVDVRAGGAPFPSATPSRDVPFCVALLGDFSARGAGPAAMPLAARRPLLVDRDDLDAALARLAPELSLDLGMGAPLRVRFTALEDFHPERLYERLPLLAALRETRRRLADPRTFAAAAAELHADPPEDPPPSARAAAARLAGGSLLDEIVGAASDAPAPAHAEEDLAGFLRRAVRPHLVPRPDPRQQELLASLDAAVAALLRLVLRHPQVRALEALWRGVDLLTRRVETGAMLRLALFDVTRDELAAAAPDGAAADDDVRDGGVYRMLAEGAGALPDPAPWSVLVSLHGPADPADERGALAEVRRLDALARLGAASGAACLAAAPAVALPPLDADGDAEDDDAEDDDAPRGDVGGGGGASPAAAAWAALRRAPHARWLGVAHPAVLLRLPYGEEGDPTDLPRFEELEEGVAAGELGERLLWGDAALAPVLVLASAFAADGWEMRPGAHLEVERLPLYLHRAGGDVTAVPPNGRLLGERDMLRLLDAGVMPLLARRDGDAVRVARVQSVAEPAAALAGRWAGAPA